MPSIQDVRSNYEPQKNYEFEVKLLGNSITGSQEILTQRVMTASIPETAVDTIPINYKSRTAYYAGRDASSHTCSVTFNDDESLTVYGFFKNWMERGISNSITGGGTSRDLYSIDMIITQFATDSTSVTATHRLTYVFPTSIGDIQLSYDASEAMQVEVTFSFDSNLYNA